MGEAFSNDTVWIRKGVLRLRERHAVLGLIFEDFRDVPFKARFAHGTRLADEEDQYHIKIWLYIWFHLFNLQPLALEYMEFFPHSLPHGSQGHVHLIPHSGGLSCQCST
jgi:hypothetical protein